MAGLDAAQVKAVARVRWVERWLSLWAPVTVFGLAFAVYLVIVESSVCTYLWLQPVLKVFGFSCVLAWAALVLLRVGVGPFKRLRKARHLAEELDAEVVALFKKPGLGLKEKPKEELEQLHLAVLQAMPGADVAAISAAAEKLDVALDKHLARWRKGGAFDFGSGFVKALAVAMLIRSILLEPFKIPSGSMIPTLEIGDQIFVNKFIYGVRIPFTNFVPFTIVRSPKRGDVIVFNNPVEPEKDFVKRVVGIPGDKLVIEGADVFVNGQKLETQPEAVPYEIWNDSGQWRPEHVALSRETIDAVPHYVLRGPKQGQHFDRNPVLVPAGHVFVMGDNRDNSMDSRHGLGLAENRVEFVPYGSIKGKAMVIWLSLSHDGFLSSLPFFEGTGLRTDRFFLPVTMCGAEAIRPTAEGIP